MEVILIIEMLAVLVLGIAFICQTKLTHSLEAKIKTLNKLLQAKDEEINYLKCRH
jgi:hypothetical protein